MPHQQNNLNEIWIYHAKSCGILDGGGYEVAHRPAGKALKPSYKITAWTSKDAVISYAKKNNLPIISESDNVVEVQGHVETLRFTRIIL